MKKEKIWNLFAEIVITSFIGSVAACGVIHVFLKHEWKRMETKNLIALFYDEDSGEILDSSGEIIGSISKISNVDLKEVKRK